VNKFTSQTKNRFIGGLIVCFGLVACGPEPQLRSGDGGQTPLSESQVPSFVEVSATIFIPRCNTCHSQYLSYVAVIRELEAISDAIISNRMPKGGPPLSSQHKAQLQAWIQAGAPEMPGRPPEPIEPPLLEANWKSISENILVPRCIICHQPSGQAQFLDLSTYGAVVAQKDRRFGGELLFDTNSPENSYLIQVIQDEFEPMPPLNSNIPQLTQPEVDALKTWISKGLPR